MPSTIPPHGRPPWNSTEPQRVHKDRVVVVSNPIAGRGGAAGIAERACRALEGAGFHAVRVPSSGADRSPMEAAIRAAMPARAIVICGGDGTVQAVAPVASETGSPVYQVPMGTENLFAREFGMSRDLDRMVGAVRAGATATVDMARCNGVTFLLMCSVGPDAAVVHRLAAARTGAITHLSYGRHVVGELLRPTLDAVSISVDGREVVRDQPGIAVVANSRQYALRIDPAYGADMRDGALDIVFLPARGRIGLVSWLALSRVRAQSWGRGAVRARGKRVSITNHGGPVVYQLDGEAGRGGEAGALDIEIVPGALRVLTHA